jgi:hypothetical protein
MNSNPKCQLNSNYKVNYFRGDAAKAFNISSSLPIEIQSQTVEYGLYNQWSSSLFKSPIPYPYTDYYVSKIDFINDSLALVKFIHSDTTKEYYYLSNECQVELKSKKNRLMLNLTNGGNEFSEQRFVIYEYKLTNKMRDTFMFIEFRNEQLKSYEEIIKIFAQENIGIYDSIAIERITNKTN